MMRRSLCLVAVSVAIVLGSWSREATAQVCYPTFGYGNAGYAAGYSFQQVGWCGPRFGGWCGPRWGGWCGPRWGGWCGPRWGGWCAPRWGGWCGPRWGCRPWGWRCGPAACWPAVSYGWPAWYGTTWFSSCDSVFLSAPGGSFFSGSMVPFPTVGYPVVMPGFASSAPMPVATLAAARPAMPQVAATVRDLRARRDLARQEPPAGRGPTIVRASNGLARLRAARLVAVGDRHLREAAGDPAKVRRAIDSYRRAATIAGDQPDTFVREAIALTALGERAQADAAMAKAVAIDGRLADLPPARDGARPDPVFGGRPADAPQPLAARGAALLRQIGAGAGDAEPAVAWLAGRWADRFGDAARTVAVNAPRRP